MWRKKNVYLIAACLGNRRHPMEYSRQTHPQKTWKLKCYGNQRQKATQGWRAVKTKDV